MSLVETAHRRVRDKDVLLKDYRTLDVTVLEPRSVWEALPDEVRERLQPDDFRAVLATVFGLFLEVRLRAVEDDVRDYDSQLARAGLGKETP